MLAPVLVHAQADLVLHNGKIITVDDRFTIVQAIAIKGERIVRDVSTPAPSDEQRPGRRSSVPPSGRPSGLEAPEPQPGG